MILKDKKIALIIAYKDFRDEEYLIPKQIFEARGAEVLTVSTSKGQAKGVFGAEADVDILIQDLDAENFDAIVFIGGQGIARHIDDSIFHETAQGALRAGKILGAICIAPCILAKAGILENKKATAWHSEMDKTTIKILKDNRAVFTDEPVVIDGNIITANGPTSAEEFAKRLTEMLE
jgi:protease I